MIDSYKNIERLRYRIKRDVENLYAEIKKSIYEQRINLVEDCFSAIVSSVVALFFSERIMPFLNDYLREIGKIIFKRMIPEAVIIIVSLLISIIVILLVANGLYFTLLSIRRKKKNSEPEGYNYVDYVKEFDNIACDSIFVSVEYKRTFLSTNDDNERAFLFFEIVHCLESAATITIKLCENPNNIKSSQNVIGVDIYRIHNLKAIMIGLYSFITNKFSEINISKSDKPALEKQLQSIDELLQKIQ